MPDSSGDKLCPICDSPLQPGSKKCSFCGTDLTIFDIEVEAPAKAPEPVTPPTRARMETKVEEVMSSPTPAPRPVAVETPRPVVAPSRIPEPVVEEPPKVPTPTPEPEVQARPEAEEVAAEEEYFECPECGAQVPVNATSCPKCGVIFAEEGAELFQCPACNTLVNVDAKECPGCGAVFVEPEAEEPSSAEAASIMPAAARVEEAPAVPAKSVVEVEEEPLQKPKPKKAPPEEKKSPFGWLSRRKKEQEPVIVEEEPVVEEPEEKPPEPVPPPQSVVERIPPPAPKPVVREVAPAYRPAPVPAPPEGKDKGKDLARMVAEMKPLLSLAVENEVDITESKRLIDEAATAGRERQLDTAIDLVRKSKEMLLSKVDANLAERLVQLKDELKVARELGGDVSRPTTYIQEIEKAKSSGDIEASFVYADKVKKELLPITGRYNESKRKIASLKILISDCEAFIVDTKEARNLMIEATRGFEAKDFDRVDFTVKAAEDKLYKAIPPRMNDEIRKAKDRLLEAKMRNVNITPMITMLKSATTLMKSGDYAHAMREMREFKELLKKAQ